MLLCSICVCLLISCLYFEGKALNMKWLTMMFVYIFMYEVLIRLLLSAVYLIVQFICYLLLFHVCLSHDGISKVLMGSGD